MICGIDPGATGAIAMIYPGRELYVEDMPMLGKEVNGAAIADLFQEFPATHIYIESQNSHMMGRQSAFIFGQGLGVIKGVISAMRIPYTQVSPAKWKKKFSLARDKDASRGAAIRLFPEKSDLFLRKKDDGRAEATLIALYGLEQAGGITNAKQE
jgi:crossover junction endodeoxyribonuclease RuvC